MGGNFFDHSHLLMNTCLRLPFGHHLVQTDLPLVEKRVAKSSDSVPIFCQVVKSRALTSCQDKREADRLTRGCYSLTLASRKVQASAGPAATPFESMFLAYDTAISVVGSMDLLTASDIVDMSVCNVKKFDELKGGSKKMCFGECLCSCVGQALELMMPHWKNFLEV